MGGRCDFFCAFRRRTPLSLLFRRAVVRLYAGRRLARFVHHAVERVGIVGVDVVARALDDAHVNEAVLAELLDRVGRAGVQQPGLGAVQHGHRDGALHLADPVEHRVFGPRKVLHHRVEGTFAAANREGRRVQLVAISAAKFHYQCHDKI